MWFFVVAAECCDIHQNLQIQWRLNLKICIPRNDRDIEKSYEFHVLSRHLSPSERLCINILETYILSAGC